MLSRHLGFQRVVFDCDSTLVTVEGIDELARLKGKAEFIAKLTGDAMDGKISLEEVYARRLELLQPTRAELTEVGRIYRHSLVPQAAEVVAALQLAGVEVFIVSGGLKAAVHDLAELLRVPEDHIHAVEVELDALQGKWWDYMHHRYSGNPDEKYFAFAPTPLAESNGKSAVLKNLVADGKRVMMVGDGSTDLVTKSVVKLFVGFGGVERRPAVVDGADVFVDSKSLVGVLPIVLSSYKAEKLSGSPLWDVFQQGLREIENGKVLFKDDAYRERILQAHMDAKNIEQVFGE